MNQLDEIQRGLEEGMTRVRRMIRVLQFLLLTLSQFAHEKSHAAGPEQQRRIRYPLVESLAQCSAANPD